MEQRPLRLGDTVDDYCPRERRITNHVIVAIVEDAIRQTRCSTCDVEHTYKGAREPRRRRKDGEVPAAADAANSQLVPPRQGDEAPRVAAPPPEALPDDVQPASGQGHSLPSTTQAPAPAHDDGWPAHRRLIRATLPRTEGEPPPARPIPEFTMHQRHSRGGHGPRQGNGWEANGNTFNRSNGSRHGAGGHQDPGGSRHGRPGKPGRHRGGKGKRPR